MDRDREIARLVAIRLGAGGRLYCPDWIAATPYGRSPGVTSRARLVVTVPAGAVSRDTVFKIRFHGAWGGESILSMRKLAATDSVNTVDQVARRMVEEALGREL